MKRSGSSRIFVTALLAILCCTAACAQVRRPLPVPDLPGLRTLKGDFHLHTVFSDGQVWPTVRVSEAWRDGLDVIALTDHVEYHPNKADVQPDNARPQELARELAAQLGLILIPAVEITKRIEGVPLHFNALFVKDANALDAPDLQEALRRAKKQDAFVFWNHPGWEVPQPRWWPAVAAAYDAGLFQGMEVFNQRDFYPAAYPWIGERKLAILCDSDAHDALEPREAAGRIRPITLLFARTADATGVREALAARRTAAWFDGQVWGAEEHLRGLWQGAVTFENAEMVRQAGDWRPGTFELTLRVRNSSAIPFQIRMVNAPDWFSGVAGEIQPEATVLFHPEVSAKAPAGVNRFEVELEVSNLHFALDRSLRVRVPLSVNVLR